MPASSHEAVIVEEVRFSAGPNDLRGELVYAEAGHPIAAAVLAGPHPLLGGSMHNNVLRVLGDGLASRGLVTLRFNYRCASDNAPGAGLLQRMTEFWQRSRLAEEREFADDLGAAVAFLTNVVGPEPALALIGYSFGCTLLPRALPTDRDTALVLIAPTVGTHGLEDFFTLANPKLVIAPHGDFALDEKMFPEWFDRLSAPKELARPTIDGHFFRGCEETLVELVDAFLDRHWRCLA
jgi:alpha/beta superfamily hydrolase